MQSTLRACYGRRIHVVYVPTDAGDDAAVRAICDDPVTFYAYKTYANDVHLATELTSVFVGPLLPVGSCVYPGCIYRSRCLHSHCAAMRSTGVVHSTMAVRSVHRLLTDDSRGRNSFLLSIDDVARLRSSIYRTVEPVTFRWQEFKTYAVGGIDAIIAQGYYLASPRGDRRRYEAVASTYCTLVAQMDPARHSLFVDRSALLRALSASSLPGLERLVDMVMAYPPV